MRVIMHFGAHKTGTSLVQKFMRDRPRLMTRNRIAAIDRTTTGQLIGWGTERHLQRDDLATALDTTRRGTRHLVISHENSLNRPLLPGGAGLYPRARQNAERIRSSLGGRPALAVYYIRTQPAFIESYYLQTIHEGAYHTFADWFAPFNEADLSWRPVRDALVAAFGKENVILHSFEDEMARGQAAFLAGFFSSFSALGSAPPRRFDYAPLRNPSIGNLGLKIALAANPYLSTPSQRRKMRKFLQRQFSNRHYPRPQLLDECTRAEMAARYQAENMELIRESELATAAWRSG